MLEYGELLQSLGRTDGTPSSQYAVFVATQQLFEANGVEPDAAATLFDAAHGDPAQALVDAERASPPARSSTMQDANAWALHVNGRDAEALPASDRALQRACATPRSTIHAGMIKMALGDRAGARDRADHGAGDQPVLQPARRAARTTGAG